MVNMSKMSKEEMVGEEPMSPGAQYFTSSALNISILAVFESEIPIDDFQAIWDLEKLFLPINSRFSSVMVRDQHGTKKWKRVKVKVEDHVKYPLFPPGIEFYDNIVPEYLSKIAREKFAEDRPPWEVHLIKYPTSNAAGIIVFKLHHALGDGFSLMSALFSCLKRAENPSLPLTFPSSRGNGNRKANFSSATTRVFSMFINTIYDFSWSLLMSNMVEDSISPIRSGITGAESRPISLSSVTFSLSDVKQIKTNVNGTVNDVITGVIFYGIQLYIQAMGQSTEASRITALVLLNTRAINNYQHLDESKHKPLSWWGNQFAFLHASVPSCSDAEKINPLYFIYNAKQTIQAKRNSLGIYLTGKLIDIIRRLKGIEAACKYVLKTVTNSSAMISNMIGPLEQVKMANHPIKSFYFMMVGAPQSLTIAIVSYNREVRVAFGAEKGLINSEILVSCMEKSFEKIFDAATGNGIPQKEEVNGVGLV